MVLLLGFLPLGGMTRTPAAMKSASPNTFMNAQSLLAAGTGCTMLEVSAIPGRGISDTDREVKQGHNIRLATSSAVGKSNTTHWVSVSSSQPSSGFSLGTCTILTSTSSSAALLLLRPLVGALFLLPNGSGASLGIRTISRIGGTRTSPFPDDWLLPYTSFSPRQYSSGL